jgi:hypothetical protein
LKDDEDKHDLDDGKLLREFDRWEQLECGLQLKLKGQFLFITLFSAFES